MKWIILYKTKYWNGTCWKLRGGNNSIHFKWLVNNWQLWEVGRSGLKLVKKKSVISKYCYAKPWICYLAISVQYPLYLKKRLFQRATLNYGNMAVPIRSSLFLILFPMFTYQRIFLGERLNFWPELTCFLQSYLKQTCYHCCLLQCSINFCWQKGIKIFLIRESCLGILHFFPTIIYVC